MNQLKCEMCGSTDIVKQDGMFVCQVCGTKYSVEEAKKMMIEGTVEVTGSVKIDSSDELEKLYKVARRAKNDGDNSKAREYYDKILERDPTSWEAYFYVKFDSNIKRDFNKEVVRVTLTFVKDIVSNKENQIAAVKEIAEYCMINVQEIICNITKIYKEELEQYNTHTSWYKLESYPGDPTAIVAYYSYEDAVHNYKLAFEQLDREKKFLYFLGDSIEDQFYDYEELKPTITTAWKEGVQQHNKIMGLYVDKETNENLIKNYVKKIQKYDPHYVAPEHVAPDIIAPVRKEFKTAKAGCYIATCVYGSYDCPEVWTLRRYRDSKLGASHGGRAFIRLYYAISPTLVKWFGNTNWFKKMWRGVLDKKVKKLQTQGYESTPYDDIDWRK